MLFLLQLSKFVIFVFAPLKEAKRFFLWILDSLKFVIKKLGEQPIPRVGGGGGEGGTARWDI